MELLNNDLFIPKKKKETTLSLWQPKFILETNQCWHNLSEPKSKNQLIKTN